MISILLNLISLAAGAAIGYTFADIDLAPPLPLKHRSIWTHGPLVPLAVLLWSPGGYWLPFFAGFLPLFALHLLKDMFPKKWAGGALIKMHPIRGHLPAGLSFVCLGLGVVWSLWLWVRFYSVCLMFWR